MRIYTYFSKLIFDKEKSRKMSLDFKVSYNLISTLKYSHLIDSLVLYNKNYNSYKSNNSVHAQNHIMTIAQLKGRVLESLGIIKNKNPSLKKLSIF